MPNRLQWTITYIKIDIKPFYVPVNSRPTQIKTSPIVNSIKALCIQRGNSIWDSDTHAISFSLFMGICRIEKLSCLVPLIISNYKDCWNYLDLIRRYVSTVC